MFPSFIRATYSVAAGTLGLSDPFIIYCASQRAFTCGFPSARVGCGFTSLLYIFRFLVPLMRPEWPEHVSGTVIIKVPNSSVAVF